ncbi:MAG TPA: hypothetical protein VM432_05940, partial [Bdellovibrionales bacterium]|nr:hypothetical protein [Bdellovibrionales bacterium]
MFRSWMIIALSALTASQVFAAGGVDGGGGKSVVCRNRGGDVVSAEVLDLFEGREMFGLNIPTSSERMEAQIRYALEVLPPSSRGLVEFYVKSVLQNMRLVSADLLPIDDSFEVMVPQG